jgi:hypothetical protein
MTGVPELQDNESVDMEFDVDIDNATIRVIERERPDHNNHFVFQATGHKYKSYDLGPEWENPHAARLYCHVYVLTRFREEKTGRRGIPENVEDYGREAVVAYQRCRSGVDADWLAHYYDIDRQRVYEYCSRIRSEAKDKYDLVADPDEE